jgi:hypothetical protein
MTTRLHKNQVGLAAGLLFAILYLIWVILVAVGTGDFLVRLGLIIYFLVPEFNIDMENFNWMAIIIGIIAHFLGGYISGIIFTVIFNRLGFSSKP